jgi:hypothetical protein
MGNPRLKLFVLSLFITGCQKMCGVDRTKMSPEEVVEAYLETALNMESIDGRQQLLELTTGSLASAISGASDDAIQKAYVDHKYNLRRYSMLERRDKTPRETEITYQLTYNELEGEKDPEKAPLVVTDNTVSVIKEKGMWFIRDVLGKKTSIEFPVTELNTISAKPGVVTPVEETPEPQ